MIRLQPGHGLRAGRGVAGVVAGDVVGGVVGAVRVHGHAGEADRIGVRVGRRRGLLQQVRVGDLHGVSAEAAPVLRVGRIGVGDAGVVHTVTLRVEHEGRVAVERERHGYAAAGALAGQAVELVVGVARERPEEGRQRAAQCPQQRNAVGVLAVDHLGELLAQALQLVGVGLTVLRLERAAAGGHHDLAHVLHQLHGIAQRRFGLGHGIALHFKRTLFGLDAIDARERALGLRGGHGVVAGTYHALAGGQVFLQARQDVLAHIQVLARVVVRVGRAHAVDGEAGTHGGLLGADQRLTVCSRLSKMLCAICNILAEAW